MASHATNLPVWVHEFDGPLVPDRFYELPGASLADSFVNPTADWLSNDSAAHLFSMLQQASPSMEVPPSNTSEEPKDYFGSYAISTPELGSDGRATSASFDVALKLEPSMLPTPGLSPCAADSDSECADSEASPKLEPSLSEPIERIPAVRSGPARTSKRTPHSQVERRYRNTLNRQLERLRDMVPATREALAPNGSGKMSKNIILTSAINYIEELELKCNQVLQERDQLREIFGLPDVPNGRPCFPSANWQPSMSR